MVSVDVYRPAAREQLRIVAKDVGLPIYPARRGVEAYRAGPVGAPGSG
jgi:signal recognition particle GTPase